jgi:hypothetical protein
MQQILNLYSDEEIAEDTFAILKLKDYPHFESALWMKNLNTIEFYKNENTEITNTSNFKKTTTAEKLKILVDFLETHGYTPMFQTLKEFSSGACVTQVITPGLEKFNLIRLGVQVPLNVEL